MIHVGDVIVKDYSIITLETEKASMDVPAPFGGEVIEIFVEKGQKINSGDLIAKVIKSVVIEDKVPTPTFVDTMYTFFILIFSFHFFFNHSGCFVYVVFLSIYVAVSENVPCSFDNIRLIRSYFL